MKCSHRNVIYVVDAEIVISPLQCRFHSRSRSLRNEVLRDINTSVDTSLMALTQSSNLPKKRSFQGYEKLLRH